MTKKFLAGVIAALLALQPAYAQNAGTVTNHAYAIGKGPGVTGYTSLLCASGQLALGSATDPTCRTMSGDATLSATGVLTLATVNANVGTFGSATQAPQITLDAKGRATAATSLTVTPAVGSITGLGAGCATWLGTPSSANLRGCVTDETGTGVLYFQNGALGTPSSGTLTSATGLPISTGVSGLGAGVASALVLNVGSAGAPVVFNGALGSPSSVGTMPAFIQGGTISGGGNQINNIIIGTTSPLAGFFTALSATTSVTSPLDIGGSGTTGVQKTFKTTTGVGTTDQFKWVGGSNGATTFGTLDITGLSVNSNGSTVATITSSTANSVLNVVSSGASFGIGIVGALAVLQPAGGITSMQFQVAGGAPTLAVEAGTLLANAHLVKGTVPTGTTGTCTASSFLGGSTAGRFTDTAICGIGGTLILSALPTSTNGYACSITDMTTSTAALRQTGFTASSVTLTVSAATVANDLFIYKCLGF